MIQFFKFTPFSGMGEHCTPWHDWEKGMENAQLVSDVIERGEADLWQCTLEVEETEGVGRAAHGPTSLTQSGS